MEDDRSPILIAEIRGDVTAVRVIIENAPNQR